MKRSPAILMILFTFLLTILACNLTGPRDAPTPSTDLPTIALPTQAVEPSATKPLSPAPTETPPSPSTEPPTNIPTETTTALPQTTLPPTFTPAPDLFRIRFEQGGTWTEVTATGQASQTSTFVLAAAKGQIMGVSVFEGPGYYLTITGADGTLLTPPDTDAYFWRGTLPATQDYVVSILSPFDASFTLRVAINPPGQSEQTFAYSNDEVSLAYSDAFAPVVYPYNFLQRDNSTLALNVIDQVFYDKTNLDEAYFVLNLFDNPAIVASCYDEYYEPETAVGPVTINGIPFEESTAIGVAAGNLYDQIIYRTVQNNVCMEVVFFMHYGNIGNYTPGLVTEFDRDALIQMFEDVLGTLTIK